MGLDLLKYVAICLVVFSACRREGCERVEPARGEAPIVFVLGGEQQPETKVTPVTSLSTLRVCATTGDALNDNESLIWSSTVFSKISGTSNKFSGGKYWPATGDTQYHFYASNYGLSVVDDQGPCVWATNSTDVVCGYNLNPVYKQDCSITMNHIFARVGRCTVTAESGCTISNLSVTITPKVAGRYYIRKGTWLYPTAADSPTVIASSLESTADNGLYLVPGSYTITASYRATIGGHSEDLTKTTVVDMVAGKINNMDATFGADSEPLVITVTLTPWSSATVEAGEMGVGSDSEYLTMAFGNSGTIQWKSSTGNISKTIYYSKNGGVWTSASSSTTGASISVAKNDVIRFKGNNEGYAKPSSGTTDYCFFVIPDAVSATLYGDMSSLLYLERSKVSAYAFSCFFKDCSFSISASNPIVLPATTLYEGCYYGMFMNVDGISVAPRLPATTLAERCYEGMFKGSTLVTPPELPATTLTNSCYYEMFRDCVRLTAAPALPATDLDGLCYYSMFRGCSSLTVCPELPATTLKDRCYYYMFSYCSSLEVAPELPATTLINRCYEGMFYRSPKIRKIKALFTTTPSSSYTRSWVYGVSASGAFIKSSSASWNVTGTSGVPSGWKVIQ